MNAIEVLLDANSRPIQAVKSLEPKLTPDMLNRHIGEHDNSIAWLLWHSGREVDVQLAALNYSEPIWISGGFNQRFGLGALGDGIGYGHSSEEARAVVVNDAALLVEYLNATLMALGEYIGTLSEDDLDAVVDNRWDPPVTRGVRIFSIIDDAIVHIGQAAYIAGAKT